MPANILMQYMKRNCCTESIFFESFVKMIDFLKQECYTLYNKGTTAYKVG